MQENDDGQVEAYVANPRLDTMSREVYRHSELKDQVELQRIRDHFICKHWLAVRWVKTVHNMCCVDAVSVESVGALPPDVLVVCALQTLRNKCQIILDELAEVQDQPME